VDDTGPERLARAAGPGWARDLGATVERAARAAPRLDPLLLSHQGHDVVTSTTPRLLEEAQAAGYGTHHYLAKPLDLDALQAAIREMIEDA